MLEPTLSLGAIVLVVSATEMTREDAIEHRAALCLG